MSMKNVASNLDEKLTARRRVLHRRFRLILLCSIPFVVLMAELTVRLTWEAPWYEHLLEDERRSQMIREQNIINMMQVQKNSLGLRDRDYDVPKPPGRKRILILGDSFTFGTNVKDDASIFPEIIERRLNERLLALTPTPRGTQTTRIDVLNGGIPRSLTHDWVELWKKAAPGFGPDLLLIVFFLRDGTWTGIKTTFWNRIRDEIAGPNQDSTLYRHLYLYRLFRDRLDRRTIGREYTVALNVSYFGSDQQTAQWGAAQKNILKLRDLANEQGANVGFVIFPILVDLDKNYAFREICDLLDEFCRSNDIPVHNLLPAFMGQDGPELWVSPRDQHPNARAHAIAADSMMPFVIELIEDADSGSR